MSIAEIRIQLIPTDTENTDNSALQIIAKLKKATHPNNTHQVVWNAFRGLFLDDPDVDPENHEVAYDEWKCYRKF
jgi:hypothetical protein